MTGSIKRNRKLRIGGKLTIQTTSEHLPWHFSRYNLLSSTQVVLTVSTRNCTIFGWHAKLHSFLFFSTAKSDDQSQITVWTTPLTLKRCSLVIHSVSRWAVWQVAGISDATQRALGNALKDFDWFRITNSARWAQIIHAEHEAGRKHD